MFIVIDRFEGEYAVVETEDSKMFNIPKSLLPDAKEGDKFEIIRADDISLSEFQKKVESMFID